MWEGFILKSNLDHYSSLVKEKIYLIQNKMFKLITDSRKTQIAIVISLLLGAIYQYISVLNIDSSLALTSMDDGPVIPYLLTKRFDLFYED